MMFIAFGRQKVANAEFFFVQLFLHGRPFIERHLCPNKDCGRLFIDDEVSCKVCGAARYKTSTKGKLVAESRFLVLPLSDSIGIFARRTIFVNKKFQVHGFAPFLTFLPSQALAFTKRWSTAGTGSHRMVFSEIF